MKSFLLSVCLFVSASLMAQEPVVFTSDIDHFWEAYDSIRTTGDSLKQLGFINRLYIDRGTPGLHAFMKARNYTDVLWIKLLRQYPKFWKSIRPNTLRVKNAAVAIEATIGRFKTLYPELTPAKMYFTIGALRSGGTTSDDKVLIGAEIATGDTTTDVSEFPTKWLAGVFREQKAENFVNLNVHEYVHTQQHSEATDLLGQCITEGACDFITELVTGKPMRTNYILYGLAHETELKEKFQAVMFTRSSQDWLYNGNSAKTVADLGYFMGYRIAGAYYSQARNKRAAIKEIIELNFADTSAVMQFLVRSAYYPGGFDKPKLLAAYRERQPVVVSIAPIGKDSTLEDTTRQITIRFSKPMQNGMSIEYMDADHSSYPLTKVIGWSADKMELSIKIAVKAGKAYGFVLSDNNFVSEDGYTLAPLTVKFRAR